MSEEEFRKACENLKEDTLWQNYCELVMAKDKIIEQLQQENKELKENDDTMTKAWRNNVHRVRQLENILNELESWLKKMDQWMVLDKLKELKESDI